MDALPPLIIAAFSALLTGIAVVCANLTEDEYLPYAPAPVEEIERVVVTAIPTLPALEAPADTPVPLATQTPSATPTPELYTLTVAYVGRVVFENAMFLYREGLIPEPTQTNLVLACSHWERHGANYPARHWIDVMQMAADEGKNHLLPTIAIVRDLDSFSEDSNYENPGSVVAQYCRGVQAEAN